MLGVLLDRERELAEIGRLIEAAREDSDGRDAMTTWITIAHATHGKRGRRRMSVYRLKTCGATDEAIGFRGVNRRRLWIAVVTLLASGTASASAAEQRILTGPVPVVPGHRYTFRITGFSAGETRLSDGSAAGMRAHKRQVRAGSVPQLQTRHCDVVQ